MFDRAHFRHFGFVTKSVRGVRNRAWQLQAVPDCNPFNRQSDPGDRYAPNVRRQGQADSQRNLRHPRGRRAGRLWRCPARHRR
ncbi:hypothetical protein CBM2587_B10218 [Cupriavidus taiwanensis]|uniref:Uncharacterized protein n=1 Tax=Cupriavidus taiwanensis TaxID=164546 RepID=A0A975X4M9_9BURK|nr:hypothetical protein CBM2587_B10218 [Cupriavidus taiwanensis]